MGPKLWSEEHIECEVNACVTEMGGWNITNPCVGVKRHAEVVPNGCASTLWQWSKLRIEMDMRKELMYVIKAWKYSIRTETIDWRGQMMIAVSCVKRHANIAPIGFELHLLPLSSGMDIKYWHVYLVLVGVHSCCPNVRRTSTQRELGSDRHGRMMHAETLK